jgi:MFS family permease
MGLMDFFVLLVPLWAISINATATEIGLLVGARSLLPLLFAIHGGALMDRLGVRQVMLVTVAVVCLLAPAYPAMHWFPTLLALQLVNGMGTTYAWIGAQTQIAQVTGGDTTHIGRFSFAGRIGTFTAPIIGGALWDFTGPWISFLSISVWCILLLICIWMVPRWEEGGRESPQPRAALRLRDMLPRASDYVQAIALLGIPMVAMTVLINFLRNTTSSVQGSFYVTYLDEIGLTGTAIGILIAAVEAASGLSSLGSAFYLRFVKAHWLIIGLSATAIALIAITPLLGGLFAVLLIAQVLRGGAQGLIQPILFSLQAKSVPLTAQGSVVGLRVTVNRLSSVTVPPLMGVAADLAGLQASLLIVGGTLLAIVAVVAHWVKRSPAFAAAKVTPAP